MREMKMFSSEFKKIGYKSINIHDGRVVVLTKDDGFFHKIIYLLDGSGLYIRNMDAAARYIDMARSEVDDFSGQVESLIIIFGDKKHKHHFMEKNLIYYDIFDEKIVKRSANILWNEELDFLLETNEYYDLSKKITKYSATDNVLFPFYYGFLFTSLVVFISILFIGKIEEFAYSSESVFSGDLYRLITCIFLHRTPVSLVFTSYILFIIATFYAKREGLLALSAVFLIGGSAAALIDCVVNILLDNKISYGTGSSGAFFAVIGACIAEYFCNCNFDGKNGKALVKSIIILVIGCIAYIPNWKINVLGYIFGIFIGVICYRMKVTYVKKHHAKFIDVQDTIRSKYQNGKQRRTQSIY